MRAAAQGKSFAAALSTRSAIGLQHQHRCFSGAVTAADDTHLPIKYKGRQSVSGITATVFGANGFVGRYVVNRLGRIGSRTVVPYRGDGMNTRHLKLMGDLGQIVQLPMDLCDEDSIRNAVKDSNVVINLIGAAHETKNYSYDDVHVKCTHRIAKICAEAGGVKRFIHVSAAGADANSNSKFLASKAVGEDVVKQFFPQATIIRPCDIFGSEDKFLNRTAELISLFPVVPLLNNGQQKLQPIYVQDVAQAIVNAMVNSDSPGKTYTLGGPEVMTKRDILEFVADDISRPETSYLEIPKRLCMLYAKAAEMAPVNWRLMSPDDVDQSDTDKVVPAIGALTCADLGVKPVTLAKEGSTVLIRHRGARDSKHNQFQLARGYGKYED